MSFDFRTLCSVEPARPAQRIAAVLLPLGAAVALIPGTPPWSADRRPRLLRSGYGRKQPA